MSDDFAWLPPLILFADFDGDWTRFLDTAYEFFLGDFVDYSPTLRGRSCSINRKLVEGKADTFWHIVSSGEGRREVISERCEHIRWPRPILESPDSNRVRIWTMKEKPGDIRTKVALGDFSYLVVLRNRKTDYFLITAFPVAQDNYRQDLRRQWERFGRK